MTTKTSTNLKKVAKKYSSLNDNEKKSFITKAYYDQNLSYDVIAELCGTYKNRIIRDAKKLGIKSKSKSEAQKAALATGRHTHPTEGKEISNETKDKISKSMVESWEGISDEEREKRKQIGKDQWNDKSDAEKKAFIKTGNTAIRKAAKVGSKLEIFLAQKLRVEGYNIEYHKKHLIANSKLHIDILIPSNQVVIEVDGLSHKSRVWGDKVYKQSSKADRQKNGLLLAKGFVIIRVEHPQSLSRTSMNTTWDKLRETLLQVKKQFPKQGERLIKLEN